MQADTRSSRPEVLAIIPARGGSKGVPRKNTLTLGDRPLLAWSVSMACAIDGVTRVIVSTDDTELADIARGYGAEIPFLRSASISGDRADVSLALAEVRNRLYQIEQYMPDCQIVLYPTHPFRKRSTMEFLVDKLASGVETVSTVRKIDVPAERYFTKCNGHLTPFAVQEKTPYYRSYGYCYGKHLRFSASGHYQHVLVDEMELIDIDTWEDLELAREVVAQNLFDFEL